MVNLLAIIIIIFIILIGAIIALVVLYLKAKKAKKCPECPAKPVCPSGQQCMIPPSSVKDLQEGVCQGQGWVIPAGAKKGAKGSWQGNYTSDCVNGIRKILGCIPNMTEKGMPATKYNLNKNQNIGNVIADQAQWASLLDKSHRVGCYGTS
jgi:hypothetical protein